MLASSPNALLTEISTEVELLLSCTCVASDHQITQKIRELTPKVKDWEYVAALADRHRVVPLLYTSLRHSCPDLVPVELLADLNDFVRAIAMHNLAMTTELVSILTLLKNEGVTAIPYKGPVLTKTLYGDPALRQYGDLDIIIRHQDQRRTIDILEAVGFSLHSEVNASLDSQLKYEYHLHFRREDNLILEVHWGFAYEFIPFPVDFEQVWERLEPTSLAGVKVLNLAPEDLLLILCVHGFKHLWSRLSWVCDVAQLLYTHPELNWGTVFEQARTLGCEHILLFGLRVARDLLQANIPQEIDQLIDLNPASQALSHLLDPVKLFSLEAYDPVATDEAILTHISMASGWSSKLRYYYLYFLYYLIRVIPPSEKDQEFLKLPRFLTMLYYIVRPIRLLTTFGLQPITPFKRMLKKLFVL
ncbi:MAG: nucleotidyltransferase family protein [Anaerolineae bacterium]|nr:nucleotidyltransferase family protein [Anaerolineae bacterium]